MDTLIAVDTLIRVSISFRVIFQVRIYTVYYGIFDPTYIHSLNRPKPNNTS